ELLALVSEPSLDTNLFPPGISVADYARLLQDPARPLYDRALDGQYPPGSTFKMITAAAALQEGTITDQTTLGCPAAIQYGGWTYKNWAGYDMGPMNVARAIALSCDTFFYSVAARLGDLTLERYARAFGYGSPPTLEIPGAAAGNVPGHVENPGETLTMGIGQGELLTTPLIQTMYVSAVANGGHILQPTLVDRVVDPSGRVVSSLQPEPLSEVPVSAANLEAVRQGMRLCLNDPHGTGYQFRLDHFSHDGGCKTGTAQYGGSGTDLPTHAWFTFFSPYDNPEIAIVVLVEGGGEGDQVAEPAAVTIADYYYAHRAAIRQA
ncbi:MAG TPA: penicillin-binding transpeptidase domain-containing protein, partial [Candidatus Dormibacteraeota bacterium]